MCLWSLARGGGGRPARGPPRRGALLHELMAPFADRNVQSGSAWCAGSAERFLGLCAFAQGDLDGALAHLERALERNTAWDIRNVLPLVRGDLARVLAARGDLAGAREHWQALIPEAEALGMAPLVRSARDGLLDVVPDG
jgi:tetratricopeptide (TPR) repeat protein